MNIKLIANTRPGCSVYLPEYVYGENRLLAKAKRNTESASRGHFNSGSEIITRITLGTFTQQSQHSQSNENQRVHRYITQCLHTVG